LIVYAVLSKNACNYRKYLKKEIMWENNANKRGQVKKKSFEKRRLIER